MRVLDYQPAVHAPDSQKLALIARVPLGDLDPSVVPGPPSPSNLYAYVFSYYDPGDYFLDNITYHGTADEWEFLRQGYTQVIIAGEDAYEFSPGLTASVFSHDPADEMSFIGGSPRFLQNERNEHLDDYLFVAQIAGGDLPEGLDDLFYLRGAVGYLFVKKDLSGGAFFVQVT